MLLVLVNCCDQMQRVLRHGAQMASTNTLRVRGVRGLNPTLSLLGPLPPAPFIEGLRIRLSPRMRGELTNIAPSGWKAQPIQREPRPTG